MRKLTPAQLLEGLAYAFPRYFATLKQESRFAALFELQSRLRETELLRNYLKSDTRTPFNECVCLRRRSPDCQCDIDDAPHRYDVFRHYPELDAEYTGKV